MSGFVTHRGRPLVIYSQKMATLQIGNELRETRQYRDASAEWNRNDESALGAPVRKRRRMEPECVEKWDAAALKVTIKQLKFSITLTRGLSLNRMNLLGRIMSIIQVGKLFLLQCLTLSQGDNGSSIAVLSSLFPCIIQLKRATVSSLSFSKHSFKNHTAFVHPRDNVSLTE